MDITTWIAVYGAVISTVTLGWSIYKQATSGPKLVGSVMTNRTRAPGDVRDSHRLFVELYISNRGHSETTIVNAGIECYKNCLEYWLKKIMYTASVNNSGGYKIPYKLGPGDAFNILFPQTKDLEIMTQKNIVYFCVLHTLSNKLVKFRVKPIDTNARQAQS